MKKSILFFFFILLHNLMDGQIPFQRIIAANMDMPGFCVHQLSDGTFLIAGKTNTSPFLIKTNALGDTLWTKTYVDTSALGGDDMITTRDGGMMIASNRYNGVDEDILLIKTDSLGRLKWTKAFNYSSSLDTANDYPSSIKQTPDGGYIVAGLTGRLGNYKAFLLKTDPLGNMIWQKIFICSFESWANSVILTSDHGYAFTGIVDTSSTASPHVYLVKTDSVGNIEWRNSYGNAEEDYGVSLKQTADGGFIITGNTLIAQGSTLGLQHVYLIKTDRNGRLQWTKEFGGRSFDSGSSIIQTADKGFLVSGLSSDFMGNNGIAFLIKTDSNGLASWIRDYGSPSSGSYAIKSMERTKDGGLVFAGSTQIPGSNVFYLSKTDSSGFTTCNSSFYPVPDTIYNSWSRDIATTISSPPIHTYVPTIIAAPFPATSYDPCATGIKEFSSANNIILFPNPNNGVFSITFPASSPSVIQFYNILGELIHTEKTVSDKTQIDLSSQPKGMYFYRVVSENKIIGSGKLVIE